MPVLTPEDVAFGAIVVGIAGQCAGGTGLRTAVCGAALQADLFHPDFVVVAILWSGAGVKDPAGCGQADDKERW